MLVTDTQHTQHAHLMSCVEVDRAETCKAHLDDFAMDSSPKVVCSDMLRFRVRRVDYLNSPARVKKDNRKCICQAFKSPYGRKP